MKRISPGVHMQQALKQTLQAGCASHPLRQFVAKAPELILSAIM